MKWCIFIALFVCAKGFSYESEVEPDKIYNPKFPIFEVFEKAVRGQFFPKPKDKRYSFKPIFRIVGGGVKVSRKF